LARQLDAELDVALSRKLRAPDNPEFAMGAIGEDGHVYLNPDASDVLDISPNYLTKERRRQVAEIAHRQRLFRNIRPPAELTGRSVIVTDDGIATGSTMIAALQTIRARPPAEIIVAVPVAAAATLNDIRELCDAVVCLQTPDYLGAIGCHYQDFTPVTDQEAVNILRSCLAATGVT
jgi:predicted phosphoribosyltransferase